MIIQRLNTVTGGGGWGIYVTSELFGSRPQ